MTYTKEELEAWVGRPLDDEETLVEKFLVPATIRGSEHVLVAHGNLQVTASDLQQVVSDEFETARWGKTLSEPLKLIDFLLLPPVELEDGTFIIVLSGRDINGGRKDYTSAWHLSMWLLGVAPSGYTIDDLLTDAEADELKPQPEAE